MHNIKLFEEKQVRTHWDAEKEQWYFSVIDVIEILTGSIIPKRYWSDLKKKLIKEGSQLYDFFVQLKFEASDGKNMVLIACKPRIYSASFNPSHRHRPNLSNAGWRKWVTNG